MIDMYRRRALINAGLLVPHPDLTAMYLDGVVAPSFSQPWHRDDVGLRLDDGGRFWAQQDVQESVELDYHGFPPSFAAGAPS